MRRQGKLVISLMISMYKYACPRSSLEADRICLSCKEEYSARVGGFVLTVLVKILMF